MADGRKILLIEDTVPLAHTYIEYLRGGKYDITHVETGAAAFEAIARTLPDLVLLDLELPDMHGLDILARLKEDEVPAPVIVITAHGSINVAVSAMQGGAKDFIVKPFSADRLRVTVSNALESARLADIVADYKERIDRDSFGEFVGRSLPMQNLYRVLESAAASDATVFLNGESGTGKELCARAIHAQSKRAGGQLVAINCGAIPEELVESELFGHVRGAFTGATRDRVGAVELANGGTLFLDEICELKLDIQVKLLRFLQTQDYQRVGESNTRRVSVRVVCATNRDPQEEVRAGRFREDLFYRLHVVPVTLPPLRERDEDIALIARHYLAQYAKEDGKSFQGIAKDAEAALVSYDWPGNVRELQNALRNIVVMNDAPELTLAMLPPRIAGAAGGRPAAAARPGPLEPGPLEAGTVAHDPAQPVSAPLPSGGDEPSAATAGAPSAAAAPANGGDGLARLKEEIRPLDDIEREAIERAIALCDGNVRVAATFLGVSPATIYRKKAKWDEEAGA